MRRNYFRKKRIFAVVFLAVVCAFSAVNVCHGRQALAAYLAEEEPDISGLTAVIEENLYGRMDFIETYGYVQRILGKRECNNFSYIRDEKGFLHYASFFREEDTDLFACALRIKRMQDYVKAAGTKVLFVVPPAKYDADETEFITGMPVNDPGSIVDELIFYLNRLGVETLDLRRYMPNAALPYEETFFRTDHHWTIPAAFYAAAVLVEQIGERFGQDLDPEGYYTDGSAYTSETYEGGMLGSMGRKTGIGFADAENFTALRPKFAGKYTREYMTEDGKTVRRTGSFAEVLMDDRVLTEREDLYSDSQYSLYLNGLRVYEKIVNEENPNGCKMFLIRDSYFSPVMAFLMPMCGQIDAIWSLEEQEELDIERYVRENEFDYLIMEVYPYNISEEAFSFFEEQEGTGE